VSSSHPDEIKVELSLSMPRRHARGVEVQLYSFLTLVLEGGELSASLPGCFTPLKNPSTYSMGAWVGPRADLDVLEKLEVSFSYQDLVRE
jgi:hypothetical protein